MVQGKLNKPVLKLDNNPMPYAKNQLKCVKYLNVRPESIKVLEENTGLSSSTLVLANIFFVYMIQKVQAMKAKMNKNIKLKFLYATVAPINKIKRQP